MEALSSRIVQLTMSKTQPWVIEPWHISACYRKMQFVVPPYAIEMPPKEISGPNLTLQGKEFLITITVSIL